MPSHPWTRHYDHTVPPSLAPYPAQTLVACLDAAAAERPAHPIALFKGRRLSYDELNRLSDAFAAALADWGVGRGDRVALVLPNTPQFLIAQFGIWKAGAIVVPLNPLYSAREFEHALQATGATTVVVLSAYYARIKAVQPMTSVTRVVVTSIKDYLPPVLRALFTLVRERRDGHHVRPEAGDPWLQTLLARHAGQARPALTIAPDDPAVILSSGGTTGVPKGVLGLHRQYVMAGIQLHHWTQPARRDWDDVVMLPLPLFHVYANVGVQALAFMGHNPLSLIPNPRDVGDVLATIRSVRPAIFCGVPTLYTAILNHPRVVAGKVSLRSIRLCFSGSAPLHAETKTRFEARTGARIIEGYSLTEAMMAVCLNPVEGTQKIGSIGIPVSDVETRIVDDETGEQDLPAGVVGELLMRAPQLMAGYWRNDAETALVLRPHGAGGPWLHTGDLAYRDEDGYIFVVDRKKDLIKTSGFQVWPREIEEVLASHEAVLEVGVAGIPDPIKGEVAKAWVVLQGGAHATEDELRQYCRTRLTPYKVPASIEFRDSLPKTMVGKILRRALSAPDAH